jgi:putative colanic acid biosynthesis acetyltransferase WcaF
MDKELHGLALNIAANRAAKKYSFGELARRVAWAWGRWLLRLSPRPWFAWRRMVLRVFGAQVGAHVRVYGSTHLYMPWNVSLGDWTALGEDVLIYSLGHVSVGSRVTISYRGHVCAGSHDLSDPNLALLKPPVIIEDGVWVGTDAFVGPGVRVGQGAVIGARAVVVRDVAALSVVAGNPARVIGERRMS